MRDIYSSGRDDQKDFSVKHESQTMNTRLLQKNRATAQAALHFWNAMPFRFIWHRVLGHRYAPDAVWLRYWSLSTRRIHDAALRASQHHGH
jgi:hypothetical protein